METPVLIPARNEEAHIGKTLDTLSRQYSKVRPIVIVNGSTDRTADIAADKSATLLESQEGVIPAIQEGLRSLGKTALDAVIVLDADTRPVSKRWSERHVTEANLLSINRPNISWGQVVFRDDINSIIGAVFSATAMKVAWADRHKIHPRTIRGGNMALRIHNEELLDELLSLPSYWPRSDLAIYDTFLKHDAEKKVLFHPESWAYTSGERLGENLKKVITQKRKAHEVYEESYIAEAPVNSQPYYSPHQA